MTRLESRGDVMDVGGLLKLFLIVGVLAADEVIVVAKFRELYLPTYLDPAWLLR